MKFDPIEIGPHEVVVPTIHENALKPKLLSVRSGDCVHVSVGLVDIGDGQGAWIPTQEDLERIHKSFIGRFGDDISFLVTPIGMKIESIIRKEDEDD